MRRAFVPVAVAVWAIGCDHAAPYAVGDLPPNPALAASAPLRLTYSPEGDWFPVWSPDGLTIGYSAARLDRADRDRCLAWIPATSGRGRLGCRPGLADTDTTNAIWTHALSPSGRLAFVYHTGGPRLIAPAWSRLYVAHNGDPVAGRAVLNLPYRSESGIGHDLAAHLQWASDTTLVYLAKHVQYHPGALGVPPDTNTFGLEIVELQLRPVPSRRTVPGTAGATAVTRDAVTGIWYATFALDPVVYAIDLATGARTPAVSFQSLGVVRDIQVRQGRVYAVAGGFLVPAPAALVGVNSQDDQGGQIAVADLGGGPPQWLTSDPGRVYLHLALHPVGDRLVAEGYQVTAGVVSRASDLWLFALAAP